MSKIKAWAGRRNWWKIAFFVMLFLFECAREVAVLWANAPIPVSVISGVRQFNGDVEAEGRWRPVGKTPELQPGAVFITCKAETQSCYVASYILWDQGGVTKPDLSVFHAQFTADGVSWGDDAPVCVTFHNRIDFKLKKVFSVRDRKPGENGAPCNEMEKRLEMVLGDGWEPGDPDGSKGHFLPLLSAVRLLFAK